MVDTKCEYVGRYEERLVQQESGAALSNSSTRGGDSYCKVGGLMRGEAWQRAIARCDLGGCGGRQNFWGVFWVSEIDSDALSVVYLVLSPGSFMLTVLRKQYYYV